MAKAKSKSKQKWFIKIRGSYLPNNKYGWLTYIPYSGYLVGVLIYSIKTDTGLWRSIFLIVPNWVAAVAVMTWLAGKKS